MNDTAAIDRVGKIEKIEKTDKIEKIEKIDSPSENFVSLHARFVDQILECMEGHANAASLIEARLRHYVMACADQVESQFNVLLNRIQQDLSTGKFKDGTHDEDYYAAQTIELRVMIEQMIKTPVRRQLRIVTVIARDLRGMARSLSAHVPPAPGTDLDSPSSIQPIQEGM